MLKAIAEGVALLTCERDASAFADSYDDQAGRCLGLRGGQVVTLTDADTPGLLVKADTARRQFDAERTAAPGEAAPAENEAGATAHGVAEPGAGDQPADAPKSVPPRRFHGAVELDPARVGRDASQIADEVISHLAGLVGRM